jgi:hypothetical protein
LVRNDILTQQWKIFQDVFDAGEKMHRTLIEGAAWTFNNYLSSMELGFANPPVGFPPDLFLPWKWNPAWTLERYKTLHGTRQFHDPSFAITRICSVIMDAETTLNEYWNHIV